MTHFKYTFIFPEVKYPFKLNNSKCTVHSQKNVYIDAHSHSSEYPFF